MITIYLSFAQCLNSFGIGVVHRLNVMDIVQLHRHFNTHTLAIQHYCAIWLLALLPALYINVQWGVVQFSPALCNDLHTPAH